MLKEQHTGRHGVTSTPN